MDTAKAYGAQAYQVNHGIPGLVTVAEEASARASTTGDLAAREAERVARGRLAAASSADMRASFCALILPSRTCRT